MLQWGHIPVVSLHGFLPGLGHFIIIIHGLRIGQPRRTGEKEFCSSDDGDAVGLFQPNGIINPLFPFGFGLSYTTFSYDNLSLDKSVLNGLNDSLYLSVELKNTGDRSGAEIIQVYAHHTNPKIDRPLKELVGFEKVYLKSKEKKTVKIRINGKDLAYYDVEIHDWKLDDGEIKLLIGSSSQDIYLEQVISYS